MFQTYQRYNFESKSQLKISCKTTAVRCFRPTKDTILRANHNWSHIYWVRHSGVSDLPKIQFWEQITTISASPCSILPVFQTYQRYNFESKSQPFEISKSQFVRCFRPTKDTILRANHNKAEASVGIYRVFQTYQRYNFESKSQLHRPYSKYTKGCFRPTKDTLLRANHNASSP